MSFKSGLLQLALASSLVSVAAAESPVAQIGVIIDGPWSVDDHDQVRQYFAREVQELTQGEFDVRFTRRARRCAGPVPRRTRAG
jgi:hypothetical protein